MTGSASSILSDTIRERAWTGVKWLVFLCVIALAAQVAQTQGSTAQPPPAAPELPKAPPPAPAPVVAAPAPPPAAEPVLLDLERPLVHGDYAWEAEGVAPGPLRIRIDIATETLSVFRGNVEIGRAVILYGTDDKPTPTGIFRITEKDADHVSNIYGSPMPWMLRLTNDGVAIHGSIVELGSATRGCVGVPDEFAQLLFAEAKLGDEVTIVGAAPEA